MFTVELYVFPKEDKSKTTALKRGEIVYKAKKTITMPFIPSVGMEIVFGETLGKVTEVRYCLASQQISVFVDLLWFVLNGLSSEEGWAKSEDDGCVD